MAVADHLTGARTAGTPPEASFTVLGTTGDTTAGVFCLMVDLSSMDTVDVVVIQCLEKARTADTIRVVWETYLAGLQSEPLFISPSLMLLHGWQFQLKQTAGTARVYPWSIVKA